MRQYVRFSSLRQFCIYLWNVAGALHSPKDMQSHSKKPRLPTVNAVYCFDSSLILICQNSDFRSRHENAQHRPGFECLLDSWQWVEIFLHAGIEMAELYAKAETPVLLLNQYQRVTPSTLAGKNHIWIQHLLQVCKDFFHQWWRNPPELFLKWGIISDFNHMFSQMSAAKLAGF